MQTLSLDALHHVPLFSGLDEQALRSLSASLTERPFHAGDVLAREGEGGVGFFLIDEGEAVVTVGGVEHRTLGPGDWFGEIALIDGGPRSATVTATTDGRSFGLTSWQFKPLVDEQPTIAWPLLAAMAQRVREAER